MGDKNPFASGSGLPVNTRPTVLIPVSVAKRLTKDLFRWLVFDRLKSTIHPASHPAS